MRRPEQDSGVFDTEEASDDHQALAAKIKASLPQIAFNAIIYPFTHVKTLQQLGYEPYPLTKGKFWFVGSERMFLPNTFSYIRYFARDHGAIALFTGVDSFLVSSLVRTSALQAVRQYIDQKHPTLGGNMAWADNLKESDLDDNKALRRLFRRIVRDSAVNIAAVIATRPFVVIMTRQVAQYMGGENHYGHVFQSLGTIIREEGYSGLFRGLAPEIIATVGILSTMHTLNLVFERTCLHLNVQEPEEEEGKHDKMPPISLKSIVSNVIKLVVAGWFYSYNVTSTCMAVQGTGLNAALPGFETWQDCMQTLQKTGNAKRGASMLMRVYNGPVKYSVERQAYVAANRISFMPVINSLPYSV